ncbi:MAG: hypothetical protein HY040_27565 [Planctomycetes bacterium]|nr:hypothetical protein [Planctomycetota bacterium]
MAAPKNARDIFLDALDRAPADRAAFVAEACGDDVAVRQRVKALLRANDDPGAFLSEANPGVGDAAALPPATPGDMTVDSGAGEHDLDATGAHTPQPDKAPQPGTTDYRPPVEPGLVIAGRYTLVEKIGEGGMGEVCVAKQTEPVKRKVALKLIKTGMDSKAVLARFEQETQALAMMVHPNIARVLDGGMTRWRPGGQSSRQTGECMLRPAASAMNRHEAFPRQRRQRAYLNNVLGSACPEAWDINKDAKSKAGRWSQAGCTENGPTASAGGPPQRPGVTPQVLEVSSSSFALQGPCKPPGGRLVHFLHHIGTSSSTAHGASAVNGELSAMYIGAGRFGDEPPAIIVRSHRHRYIKVQLAAEGGEASAVVTPGWQLKTPFAWKIAGARTSTPQVGGILVRGGDDELYTLHKVWRIEHSKEVKL